MKLVSGLDEGYWNRDVHNFLELLTEAVILLDTLGQIQATVGGLDMQGKAGQTFECHAGLKNTLGVLKSNIQKAEQNDQ